MEKVIPPYGMHNFTTSISNIVVDKIVLESWEKIVDEINVSQLKDAESYSILIKESMKKWI